MKHSLFIVFCTIVTMLIACSPSVRQSEQATENVQNQFLISLPKGAWQSHFPDLEGEMNIFQINQDGSILQPIVTGLAGHNFVLSLSPNREKMLVASYDLEKSHDLTVLGSLYVIDTNGLPAVQLSESFPLYLSGLRSGALWLSNDEIAFIAQGGSYTQIHTINSDGSNEVKRPYLNRLSILNSPLYLLAFRQDEKVLYWQNGRLDAASIGISHFPTRSELDGSNLENLQTRDNELLVWEVAPTGNLIAWGKEIITDDGELFDRLYLKNLELERVFWSPNGDMLLIQACFENGCSERVAHYLWQQETRDVQALVLNTAAIQPGIPLLSNSKIDWVVWSPDQTKILLLFADDQTPEGESIFQMLTLETMELSPIFQALNHDATLLSSIQWLQSE